jgi:actin-related protein
MAAHFLHQVSNFGAQTSPKQKKSPCCLIVDSGFSSTTITPFFNNTALSYATRRFTLYIFLLSHIFLKN